jgi:hypothetical protein
VLYVIISIGWGIVVARVIEVPVLRLRDRLFPSRSGNVTEAPRPGPAVPGPASGPSERGTLQPRPALVTKPSSASTRGVGRSTGS